MIFKYNEKELYEQLKKSILENDLTRIKLIIENHPNYEKLDYNRKLLIEAIKQSSKNFIIEYFMNNEISLNYEILSGNTPLFEALYKHNYSLVDELLKRGSDINYVNYKGYNALFYLKESSKFCLDIKLFEYLINHNINLNLKNKQYKTFLECLIEEENVKLIEAFLNCVIFNNNMIIKFLINAKNKIPISNETFSSIIKMENEKIKISQSIIDTIINKNNHLLLQLLLKYKFNILNNEIVNNTLLKVCKLKNIEFLKVLIKEGADINYKEKDTLITSLMSLSIIDKKLTINHVNAIIFNMFNLLLNAGANINAKDAAGKSALMYILSTKRVSLKLLKLLIKHGAQINDVDNLNISPLIYACKGNNKHILKFLLESGADTSIVSKDGKQLISFATMNNCIFLARYLIESNIIKDINCVDKNFETPLMFAVQKKNIDMIRYLLNNGADVNFMNKKDETALSKILSCCRISKKMMECLKVLIDHGADVNRVYSISNNNNNNGISYLKETPLIFSVNRKNLNLIKFFINNGANIDGKDDRGATPLYYAIFNSNKVEIVKYLVEKGANINEIINDSNETVIFWALRHDRYNAVKLLINHGVNINHKNSKNEIPLNMVLHKKNCIIPISDFISDDTNFEERDSSGNSLFHYSILKNNREVFNFIMDNIDNVNINLLDKQENTPLMLAVSTNNIEFVIRILERKPKLEIRNIHLETALFISVKKGNYRIAKLLIENGAKINNSNIEINKKLLSYAIRFSRLIQLLLKNGFEINDYIINSENNYDNNNLLSIATISQKMMNIRFLLANNANPYINNNKHLLPFQEIVTGYCKNKFEISKKIIECYESYGVNINEMNEYGENLLYCIITTSYDNTFFIERMAKYLIEEKNANVNSKNRDNVSFLMSIVSNSNINIEFIKYIVEEQNCDINAKDYNGNNALMYALMNGNSNIYNYLIDKCQDFTFKNDEGTNLLMCAAKCAETSTIKKLIEKGISINDVDNKGRNALFYIYNKIEPSRSAKYSRFPIGKRVGKLQNFKYLIDQGININCTDNEGDNPMFHINSIELIKYAVGHGLDITHRDNKGCTILFYTTNLEIIKYAIGHGVNASLRDHNGHTAVYNIKPYNNYNYILNIIYLVKHGADIKDFQFGCKNQNYFHWCYTTSVINQFIKFEFNFDNINILDNETDDKVKETFLDYFITNYHKYKAIDFVNIFKNAMDKKLFDINRKNFIGDTPLLFLMKTLSKDVLQNEQLYYNLIISMTNYGADLEIYGMNGKTPLYYALMLDSSIVKFFYSKGARMLSYNGDIKSLITIKNIIMHDKCNSAIKCEMIQYFENIQQINTINKIDGIYIIFPAIEQKNYNLVKYLISKNIPLNLINDNNETIVDVAKRTGDISIINLIIKATRTD
ncbi:ankyrin [Piromyces finnis]|uniref:Ankyrin n=1 Tax=Piromyces finnis TaxID=1754191 RepID=A0A1Y1VJL3_9FUNG|nr:ankyrin [Piromyces finnis]|eukprot:ORX57695.1 ankyrin [Piromyces finnis]